MKKIVLVKGQSQYNSLNISTDQLAEAFIGLGNEIEVVDMGEVSGAHDLGRALVEPCSFVFSFNGMGCDLRFQGESATVYDSYNIPFVFALGDHPIYHIKWLKLNKNQIVICGDNSHLRYVKENDSFSNIGMLTSLIFSPISLNSGEKIDHEDFVNRQIKILFAGTYTDPIVMMNRVLSGNSKAVSTLLSDIIEVALVNDYLSIDMAATEVLSSRNIVFNKLIDSKFVDLLWLADKVVRGYRRHLCVETLVNAGLKVDVCGNGWETCSFAEQLTHHKPQTAIETLQLTQSAKICLNCGPLWPESPHERVLSAMKLGTACVTDTNRFYENNFKDGEDIITFSWRGIEELPHKIMNIKDDNLFEIASAGRTNVDKNYSVVENAKKILEIVELYQGLSGI
jgi:hypothetical protein